MRYALAFLILFLYACNEPTTEDVPEVAAETAVPAEATDGEEQEYVPVDVPPVLTNAEDVRDLLQELYPASLKEEGIGGTVTVWLWVDEAGTVTETKMQKSSGHDSLDEAAQQVAASMVFTPAEYEGDPVSVWVAQPIDFRPDS